MIMFFLDRFRKTQKVFLYIHVYNNTVKIDGRNQDK